MTATQHTICKEGIVRSINGPLIEVEMTISSACSECHAKSVCMPGDQQKETVMAKPLYDETFTEGETVQLVLKGSSGRKAVILAYLIPFLILMTTLFATYKITDSELAGVLLSITLVVVYYISLKRYNQKLDEAFGFYVKKKIDY